MSLNLIKFLPFIFFLVQIFFYQPLSKSNVICFQ